MRAPYCTLYIASNCYHNPPNEDQVKSRVNPYMGLIPLKLFVNVVPSSSEDVAQAMRGQAKWLSRNQLRRNGGKGGEFFFCLDFQKTFHSRDVFCTLVRRFFRLGFRLLCARLARIFGFREFCKETTTVTETTTMVVYRLHVRYNSLLISLPIEDIPTALEILV